MKMNTLILLGLLTLAQIAFQCGHDTHFSPISKKYTEAEKKFHKYVPIRKHHKAGSFHPMRVKIVTSGISELETKDKGAYDFLTKTLVPAIDQHISSTFRVPESSISLTDRTAGYCRTTIPEDLKTTSDYDLVIFFKIDHELDAQGSSIIAYAGACEKHPITGRPISGSVTFNYKFVKHYDKSKPYPVIQKTDFLFTTGIHELYHAMGFSSNLFEEFVDSHGKLRGKENVIITDSTGPFSHLIKTPKVLEHARKHFNNPNLEGVPVEDQGGAGSKGSHWERIAIGNEVMVAASQYNGALSEFTLRLFEDSGWYQINYEMTEPHHWGKEQTNLLTQNDVCNYHGHTCDKGDTSYHVYADYTTFGYCSTNPSPFENHCHFVKPYSGMDCRKGFADGGFEYRAFDGSPNGGSEWGQCFKSSCEGVSKLTVMAGEHMIECTEKNQGQKVMYPDSTGGYLICPDVRDFCDQLSEMCPKDCNNQGRCLKGNKCWCYPGFPGKYCGGEEGESYSGSDGNTSTGTDTGGSCPTAAAPQCCLNNCSGNGLCISGKCHCKKGYIGEDCGKTESGCPKNCSDVGECKDGICICQRETTGDDCGEKLTELSECPGHCYNRGRCHNKKCFCNRGFRGSYCQHKLVW